MEQPYERLTPLLSELVNSALNRGDFTEENFVTTCTGCHLSQRLTETLPPSRSEHFTEYICRNRCGIVLQLRTEGMPPKPGPPPGYVLGTVRLRNPEEVQVYDPTTGELASTIRKMIVPHDPIPAERDELIKAPDGVGFEEAVKRVLDSPREDRASD